MLFKIAIRFSELFQLFFEIFLIAPPRKAPYLHLFPQTPLSTVSGVSILFTKPAPFAGANFLLQNLCAECVDFPCVAL